jgi:hypothetical protein
MENCILTKLEEHRSDLSLWCTQHTPAPSVLGSTPCPLLHIHRVQLVYPQTSHLLIALSWNYKPFVLQCIKKRQESNQIASWTKLSWILYEISVACLWILLHNTKEQWIVALRSLCCQDTKIVCEGNYIRDHESTHNCIITSLVI